MQHHTDTIAAIATPPGEGGIAVIRISGPESIPIAASRFAGKDDLRDAASHTAHFGEIRSASGISIDQVVALVFRAPHSYTGEDIVELSCHGGTLVTRRVLEAVLAAGARHAKPGEFTQRAFLNGKLDLSQAEAVADLIHAHSDAAHRASLDQLRGSVLRSVEQMRAQLIQSSSLIELELDFAEEGYEFQDPKTLLGQLEVSVARIRELASTFKFGRVWREGVATVIAGEPNVGKSSLLNALLNEERAIVTQVPGTTRDFIEESLSIEGVEFRLIDTAGLRDSRDPVESEGILRSQKLLASSDLVLFVLDASRPFQNDSIERLKQVRDADPDRIVLVVLNKIDLARSPEKEAELKTNGFPPSRVLCVSARTGEGLNRLQEAMLGAASSVSPKPAEGSVVVTNSRHHDALVRAANRLEMALQTLREGKSGEFVAVDLRGALNDLGEIIGVVTTDDILNSVFSRFCIGK